MCIRGHVHVILNFKDADASGGDPEKNWLNFTKQTFIKVNLHMT